MAPRFFREKNFLYRRAMQCGICRLPVAIKAGELEDIICLEEKQEDYWSDIIFQSEINISGV